MARPHIEFVQSQVIPFESWRYDGVRTGTLCRILGHDSETGACSTVMRYPVGWRYDESFVLGVDEEIFVLEGALTINGQTYGKHCYGHLPGGYLRRGMTSTAGAVVLTFFSGEPLAKNLSESTWDQRRTVECLDTRMLAGIAGKRQHMNSGDWDPSGTVHKTLYVDPDSGERTWLIGMMPYWSSNKAEIHPVVEEEFAILGDICFPLGTMRAGGYFWRPPGIAHGPFASWGGALHLCRCKGGPFATQWVETNGPDWNPADKLILPEPYATWTKAAQDAHREPNY